MGAPGLLIATEVGGAGDGPAAAAALAVALATGASAGAGEGVLLVEAGATPRRRPTLLSSASARRLEDRLRAEGADAVAARGRICWAGLPLDDGWPDRLVELVEVVQGPVVAHLPAAAWRVALDHRRLAPTGVLIRGDARAQKNLLALAATELRERGVDLRVATRPLGLVGARRALAGLDPGGPAGRRATRIASALGGGARLAPANGRPAPDPGETGQALVLMLGLCLLSVFAALALAALGGAASGAARVQRAADLAALSAARSLHDDAPRLLAPARRADGSPNPAHLDRREYLARADEAAREAAGHNGIPAGAVRVAFPDAASMLPVRVRVRVSANPPRAAEARSMPDASAGSTPSAGAPVASDGDYSGPLALRQGKPMRPDVARAFDRMAAAAGRAGVALVVSSGYRSDAEQARLFALNPDPRWVAPPGTSLHRCGTELDLGPPATHVWLAANAHRFGFVKRYAWEPWHFGFTRGPAPCSGAGRAAAGGRGGDRASPSAVPSYVPAARRASLLAAAARWNVSAGLLAAQLEVESGFDPRAVSSAGALGIAQFMPGTAAVYGLRDPFDPRDAIDAQAHLMADLLERFGSLSLALAAYNAGPAAVAACSCVPSYPETQAYVARVLALARATGEPVEPLEVRLVA